MRQDVPCIPQGNDFKLAIVLKEIIKTDGEVSERDIDIAQITSVNVIKPNGDVVDNTQNQVYSYALNGSTVIISFTNQGKNDQNGLPKGKYGIEVTGKRTEDSSDFCFSLPIGLAFEIVAYSTQGRFPSDSIITYTVDGVVGVALNVSGGGDSATVGTLNSTNETTQTPSASESFGGAINLHKVSKTGSYEDLLNKPTIPDAQIQADWNQTTSTAKDFIKNKPTIPSVSGLASQQWVNDQNFLKQHQDISGKENRMQIVTPDSLSFAADTGKYYRITQSGTITVTLPSVVSNYLEGFLLFFTAAADDCLHFDTQDSVIFADGYEIKAGDICEVNAVYNSNGWQVTVVKFNS